MGRSIKYLRKTIAALIGVPIFILGLILIPLPGPGILLCFIGLFILALEFEGAKSHLERSKTEIRKVTQKAKDRQNKINKH